MRSPNAKFDSDLNFLTDNQNDTAIALFELVQEVRRQTSAADDTPGELTKAEMLTTAFKKLPASADAVVDLMNDDVALGRDLFNVTVAVVQQLDPFVSSESESSVMSHRLESDSSSLEDVEGTVVDDQADGNG